MGCDRRSNKYFINFYVFQSTHPSWGATISSCDFVYISQFQSTHPSWGATSEQAELADSIEFQSTHPSWGATSFLVSALTDGRFQSTHPSWGATCFFRCYNSPQFNFNPRTHRGVRRFLLCDWGTLNRISIHAPIVGCDCLNEEGRNNYAIFQSTHPSWGAT